MEIEKPLIFFFKCTQLTIKKNSSEAEWFGAASFRFPLAKSNFRMQRYSKNLLQITEKLELLKVSEDWRLMDPSVGQRFDTYSQNSKSMFFFIFLNFFLNILKFFKFCYRNFTQFFNWCTINLARQYKKNMYQINGSLDVDVDEQKVKTNVSSLSR